MRFAFTPDQEQSRRTFRELLERDCTPGMLRRAWTSASGRIPELWGKLAEFGVVGITAPETSGGLALGELDLVLLLEEAGRAALPEPLAETTAVAIPCLAALADDARAKLLLERAASGNAVVVVGFESTPYVSFASSADAFLVQRGDEAHLLAQAQVSIAEQRSVDGARRLGRLTFRPEESTCIARGPRVSQAFACAYERSALAAAAELVGLGARALEMAIEYAKTRHQFGQPIGSFQAVKHQLVDAHLKLAFARPLVYRAAYSLAREDPSHKEHVSAAKACASDASWLAARTALQVHGAIGYSYEHDLHLYMKRIWALCSAFGDAEWHRRRVASAILDDA
jgi:alkylation response protein AidB-like acyl-CoA dehydrogenase